MRRLYTLFTFVLLGVEGTFAQDNGTGYVGDAYYRIHNLTTERYIYVTDNKDYYDMSRDAEDFQAIQLWKDASKTISAPATVIFMHQFGNGQFDLQAQGTGVLELTGYTVKATKKSDGTYEVSATKGGVTKYLSDDRSNNKPQGLIGSSGGAKYRRWVVDKIETNHATNYFGITPSVELNGKYYQAFYAVFPFKTASPNMHVYYASKMAGSLVTLHEIDGEIPGSTPVIIECASPNPSDNRLELLLSTNVKVSENKLEGVYFCNGERPQESVDAYTAFDPNTMRVLTVSNGKLVMSNNAPEQLKEIVATDWETIDDMDVTCIPENTCYLKALADTPDELNIRFVGVGIDEILAEDKDKSAEGVFTMSGQQLRTTNDVKGLPAGLYIVGGHKFAIK